MHIDINLTAPPPGSRLADPTDFKAFDVRIAVPDYLWITRESLVALAGDRGADPEWLAKLNSMVDYAAQHGWIDEQGRIRAHVIMNEDR